MPGVRFVNINVAPIDAVKHSGLAVQADAREALTALTGLLDGFRVDEAYAARYTELDAAWDADGGEGVRGGGAGAGSAHPELGHRSGQRAVRPDRRGRLRGRLDAGRSAQAVADPGPEGLPRRVRLLLHGLRGRRRSRRAAGLPGPGRVRDGRRRLVPDDGHRARHRGAGGHQDHHGAGAEPRLRLHRLAVGVPGLAAVRDVATASATPPAVGWTGRSCRSTWPPTRRASASR